ncbi:MAG TPA: glycosyltransferase [Alphaproteobacteria bacterium]|nr:glycosyltransferase [Alphaproteobacteria bacterium]
MNIAFYGSSLVSAYWNGAATYYRGIVRALAARGHCVTFFEPDAYDRQKHRDIPDPEWATVVVYESQGQAGVERVLRAGHDADLIIKASGVGVFDDLLEAGVLAMRRPGQLVAFWDVDAAATLHRLQTDPADPFRALVPRYDLILTYGGGQPVVDAYTALGAQRCVPVYNGLDPDTHHPVPPAPRFAGDLSLLANRLPDREARIEEFFLKAAALLPDRQFVLGGNGWQDKPMPPNVRAMGHIYTADHNAFNCSALAVLNVCRDSMAQAGYSPATRVFEAAGAAACLITDLWIGIDHFFEPDVEILVAASGEQVAALVAGLTPERARQIGAAAFRRARAEHTYEARVRGLEAVLEGHDIGALVNA